MKSYVMRFGSGDPRTFTGMNCTMLIFTTDAGVTVSPPGISEVLSGSGMYYFNWGTTTAISFLADAATTSPGTTGRYVAGSIDPADRTDEYAATMIALGVSHIAQGNTSIAIGTTGLAAELAQGLTMQAIGSSLFAFGSSNIALGTTGVAIGTTILASELAQGLTMQAIGSTLTALGTTSIAIGTSLSAISVTIVVSIVGIGTVGSTFGGVASDPIDLFGYMKRIQENLEGNSTFTKLSGAWQIASRGSSTVLANKSVINTSTIVTKS